MEKQQKSSKKKKEPATNLSLACCGFRLNFCKGTAWPRYSRFSVSVFLKFYLVQLFLIVLLHFKENVYQIHFENIHLWADAVGKIVFSSFVQMSFTAVELLDVADVCHHDNYEMIICAFSPIWFEAHWLKLLNRLNNRPNRINLSTCFCVSILMRYFFQFSNFLKT